MWQPNRAQWRLIWPLAIFVVVMWPHDDGASLGVRALHWLADPSDALPRMPEELPMGLGDDGDAVAAHDAQLNDYLEQTERSSWIRTRIRIKELTDPFTPSATRQILVALIVLGGLAVWRIGGT